MDNTNPRGQSPGLLEELNPDASTPEQTHARYQLYKHALEKGRRLVADLRETTKVRGVHPPLNDKYKIVHKQYRPSVKPLNPEPQSIPTWRDNHCALVKTAPQSGTFVVSELERKFDYWYVWRTSLEARMSEILWKTWETAVNAQSLSPNLLRRVWIDRVMNTETRLVV
ncbi:hypothetical protein FBULB1_14326 [Fusarium bulbicola]|nr:hypothetical protein FBULB1_14326 [Fusarium bulbicola]